LGALATKHPATASGLVLIVTLVLAERGRLHSFAVEMFSRQELLDALFLGVAALVVLPLLPNRNVGPFGGFNPFVVWRLVVAVMALSGLGHFAQRWMGARYGLPLSGLASGFVSSIATIAAMGARARRDPEQQRGAIAGAVTSNIATVVQLFVIVSAASAPLIEPLILPLGAALVVSALYAVLTARTSKGGDVVKEARAFDLRVAVTFAVVVTVVTAIAKIAHARFGINGLFVASALSAFADTHAAAGSVAAAHAAGGPSTAAAAIAVLFAFSANALTKIVVAYVSGPRMFATRVSFGVVLNVVVAWTVWFALR
jgi:uncharacterized membrane protein (DUF4010 family)